MKHKSSKLDSKLNSKKKAINYFQGFQRTSLLINKQRMMILVESYCLKLTFKFLLGLVAFFLVGLSALFYAESEAIKTLYSRFWTVREIKTINSQTGEIKEFSNINYRMRRI